MSAPDPTERLTYTCDRCGRAIPRNDVSRLLHLQRQHPHLYQQVEQTYLSEVARLNDVTQEDLARETEGLGAQLMQAAMRASAEVKS